jgi:hypothetical protein
LIAIREAKADDFGQVYPILLNFQNSHVTKEQWRQLFVDHSGLQNGVFGYVMTDGDEIVGFLATTFGERTVCDKRMRLCNLSNWIVKEPYRSQSLGLLTKALESIDESVTITNLSPTPSVLKVFEMLRFRMFDKTERIILPSPVPALWKRAKIVTEPDVIAQSLRGELLEIFRHHRLPYNKHVLIQAPEGACYVLMNRSYKTVAGKLRLPFGRVHHMSAPAVFVRHADRLVASIMLPFRIAAVVVDERALRGGKVWHSVERPGAERRGAFRSQVLGPEDVDGLYSEAVLLNY